MESVIIPVSQLREGDVIVTGKRGAGEPVRELVPGRACNGVHVNGNACWDKAGFVAVKR